MHFKAVHVTDIPLNSKLLPNVGRSTFANVDSVETYLQEDPNFGVLFKRMRVLQALLCISCLFLILS